jgi:uncharacterized protein (DUF2236 family)
VDFDVRDVIEGAALLAGTANVIMQLARPAVDYGVVESTVETGQVTRHPLRRLRNTIPTCRSPSWALRRNAASTGAR